jgi:hypothetical protein
MAEATASTANRLAEIAVHITHSFRALLDKFSSVGGVSLHDRGVFVMGLYDGMMNEVRNVGQRLPSRAKVTKMRKPKKGAVGQAAGLHIHPYTVALSLGSQFKLRFFKLRRQQNAKPSITIAAPRRRESARGAATELYILIVTATAKDSLGRWTRNFIGAPLKHIADHVVQAPGVRLETAHRRGERIPVIERKRGRRVVAVASLVTRPLIGLSVRFVAGLQHELPKLAHRHCRPAQIEPVLDLDNPLRFFFRFGQHVRSRRSHHKLSRLNPNEFDGLAGAYSY